MEGRSSATPKERRTIPKARRSSPLHFLLRAERDDVRETISCSRDGCLYSRTVRCGRRGDKSRRDVPTPSLITAASDEDAVLGAAWVLL